jgi:hypothetical protein
MKKVALVASVALFAVCLVGLSFAQGLNVEKVAGNKAISVDAFGNTVAQPRYGTQILNNLAVTAWWSGLSTDYYNLDWGWMNDTNLLADEVIDGFAFVYGTNNTDVAGEDFSVYFFDSCTGTGYMGVQETGFGFTGLPNAATFGTLTPGWGWVVTVTVDIEGTGYEFLIGKEWGMAVQRNSTPMLGSTGIALGAPELYGGNSCTGTLDRFDTYYPTGGYENTWFTGNGYPAAPWFTFPSAFYGGQDPAAGMTYVAIGGHQGNDSGYYSIGSWSSGGTVDYMLRKNGMKTAGGQPLPGWILVQLTSYGPNGFYMAGLDITIYPTHPFLVELPMAPDSIGDFDRRHQVVGAGIANARIYLQGAMTSFFAGGSLTPIDCSNGLFSN